MLVSIQSWIKSLEWYIEQCGVLTFLGKLNPLIILYDLNLLTLCQTGLRPKKCNRPLSCVIVYQQGTDSSLLINRSIFILISVTNQGDFNKAYNWNAEWKVNIKQLYYTKAAMYMLQSESTYNFQKNEGSFWHYCR